MSGFCSALQQLVITQCGAAASALGRPPSLAILHELELIITAPPAVSGPETRGEGMEEDK
jgi:hypothetical protein